MAGFAGSTGLACSTGLVYSTGFICSTGFACSTGLSGSTGGWGLRSALGLTIPQTLLLRADQVIECSTHAPNSSGRHSHSPLSLCPPTIAPSTRFGRGWTRELVAARAPARLTCAQV